MSRKYEKVQGLYPEIKKMLEEGYTQREVAKHYGLGSAKVIYQLLNRERRKEKQLAEGVLPKAKGRPRKGTEPEDIVEKQALEIRRLKMENELLRDFLSLIERK